MKGQAGKEDGSKEAVTHTVNSVFNFLEGFFVDDFFADKQTGQEGPDDHVEANRLSNQSHKKRYDQGQGEALILEVDDAVGKGGNLHATKDHNDEEGNDGQNQFKKWP